MHQRDVAERQGHGHSGGNQRPLPRPERHVDRGVQVCSGVTGVCVDGQRQVTIKSNDGDLQAFGVVTVEVMGGHDRGIYRLYVVDYVERLTVPLRWWVQGTMLVASLWLAVMAATPMVVAWSVTGVALIMMIALLMGYGRVRVVVDDGQLRAGRAHIPLDLLGDATSLDAQALRRLAGVDADARAYLVLRPYLKRGVRIDIADPGDPTPYWLLSCRRPEQLVSVLDKARQS